MTTNGGGYERSDADIPSVWKFIIGLFALIGVSLLLMLGLFRFLYQSEREASPTPTPMEAQRVLPPAPRLQITTSTDIDELRRREDEILRTYGWVDKNAGVVRVPVDRAIDLLTERGLPQVRKK
jgi:hypothetical protein